MAGTISPVSSGNMTHSSGGQELLLFREHIHDLDFVPYVPSLVLRIGDHVGHGGVSDPVAVVIAITFFPENLLDLLHGVFAGGVELKQFTHHLSFFIVNDQALVVLLIAEDAAVAEDDVLLDGLLMAEFHAGGQLAKFILGDGGHDREPQLRVLVQGVDVVVLEEYADAVIQQFACVLDGVQRVSGKAGNLLCDDQIEFVLRRVVHHAVEVLTLLGGNSGKSFVDVSGNEGPGHVLADQVFVIGNLV